MDELTTDKLLAEAFEKLRSKLSGAVHAAGQFVKTGNVGLANAGYSAQSVAKRTELFKKNVGDYLSQIKKFDSTRNTTLLKNLLRIGPIAIQSKSSPTEPLHGEKYQDAGLEYTYDAKSKYWIDAGGKKMSSSPAMTKKFMKTYPSGYVAENISLNEAGEVFAYEREIEKQIKSFITDLANQFNVTGDNTKEILTKLESLSTVPELKKAVTELNSFIFELGKKTKLTVKLPDVKLVAKQAAKPTTPAAPAAGKTPAKTPSTPSKPSASTTTSKKGDSVMVGKYEFKYDGSNWINPITKKAETRDLILKYIDDELSKSSSTSASTPSSGTPKDGAIDRAKKYKFDAGKNLWVDIASKKYLNKSASDAKTRGYWNDVKAGKIISEGITKLTYKEFFV